MPVIVCETERLLIRQIELADFEMFYAICSDAEVMKYVGSGHPLSAERTQHWIEITRNNYLQKGYGNCAVIDKASQEFIGYCGLVYSKEIDQVELIYTLKKAYWGRGLATEAARAMVRFGRPLLQPAAIYASVDPENIPSRRILEKTGFRYAFSKQDADKLTTDYYLLSEGEG
jgi:[ribosomal protein S5]-alanine N-acetyltransferase